MMVMAVTSQLRHDVVTESIRERCVLYKFQSYFRIMLLQDQLVPIRILLNSTQLHDNCLGQCLSFRIFLCDIKLLPQSLGSYGAII